MAQPAALPQPRVRHHRRAHRQRSQVRRPHQRVPLDWTPAHVEEYLRGPALDQAAAATPRSAVTSPRCGCSRSYVANPDYGWDRVCEQRFGTHPAQVFFDWNTATHVQDNEGRPTKRPFTKRGAAGFFDHADDQVERDRRPRARRAGRPAYRDAVMFKVAYSYGLRFNELRHLQTVDFARNPHARRVRQATASARSATARPRKGSPPKPRSVLTVFDWTAGRPRGLARPRPARPRRRPRPVPQRTRRPGRRIDPAAPVPALLQRAGAPPDGLDLHSFRRSYATHLIEDGWDPRFVQDQMGHEHASTTGIYQFVSDDFRNTHTAGVRWTAPWTKRSACRRGGQS